MASFSYIHESLLSEILFRLPVKSLLRFKCVCQSWHSLITSPAFISMHLKNYASSYYLFYGADLETRKLIVSFVSPTMNKNNLPPVDLVVDLDVNHRIGYLTFLHGPCNGIFCAHTFGNGIEKITLWNPATKELKPVKLPEIPAAPIDHEVIGFGCDAKTNDYKVLFHYSQCKQYLLYSLRNDYWKILGSTSDGRLGPRIGSPIYDGHITTSVSLKNNRVCWFAREEGITHNNSWKIALFDVVEEMFKIIRLPPDIEALRATYRIARLYPYKEDSVALIISDPWGHRGCPAYYNIHQVWMTKDDSLTSWIKLFSVRLTTDQVVGGPVPVIEPHPLFGFLDHKVIPDNLGLYEDEQLVFCLPPRIIQLVPPVRLMKEGVVNFVDPSTGEAKRCRLYQHSKTYTLRMLANFKESLVSLKSISQI